MKQAVLLCEKPKFGNGFRMLAHDCLGDQLPHVEGRELQGFGI